MSDLFCVYCRKTLTEVKYSVDYEDGPDLPLCSDCGKDTLPTMGEIRWAVHELDPMIRAMLIELMREYWKTHSDPDPLEAANYGKAWMIRP